MHEAAPVLLLQPGRWQTVGQMGRHDWPSPCSVHASATSLPGMRLDRPVQAHAGQGVTHKTTACSMAVTVRHWQGQQVLACRCLVVLKK